MLITVEQFRSQVERNCDDLVAELQALTGRFGSEEAQALLQRVTQTYRILFTRALKGVYVWIPDAETRAHLVSAIV